jgi:hypothetical protein
MRNNSSGSMGGRPVSPVAILQPLVNEAKVDVLIDQPQQMILWNLIL